MNTLSSLSIQLHTENHLLEAGTGSQRVLEIRLAAPPKQTPGKRMALNISLVIDRSGSMHGPKLEYVKQAAAHVVDLLGESDRVSLVLFDDTIKVAAESTQVTDRARGDLKRRIQQVKSGGSTNLSGGWLAGCQQVAQHQAQLDRQVDRTLLLTDGEANCGITGLEELGVHARELAERGVSTSTFGVGEGFNEQLLEVMANNGGGSFTYIVSPVHIPDIFAREFSEMMAITARDVEVTLAFPVAVEADLLGSWRVETTGTGVTRIFIGSLVGSQEKNLYYDLKLPAGVEGEMFTLAVSVRGRAESGELLESQAELVFKVAPEGDVQAAVPDQALLERAALARMAHVSTRSLEMERKGLAAPAADLLFSAIHIHEKYLDDETRQNYSRTAQRMKAGMDEVDRKRMHYQAYLHRNQKVDDHFQAGTGSAPQVALLRQLQRDQVVRLHDSPLLSQTPAALPASFRFDRVEGMLLGLAIGDALGNPTESELPLFRSSAAGDITGYVANRHAGGKQVGLPSDDTQLAFWTLEVLLQEGRLDPDQLAQRFSRDRIFGIGSTVKAFLRAYKDQRLPWTHAGQESAGNGAVMRIAPVVLPHLRQPSPALWADAVLAGMVTHNDYASNAACAAFTGMLWELLCMAAPPRPGWWAETFYRIAAPLEGNTLYTSRMPGLTYRGPVSQFVRQEVNQALMAGSSTLQASNTWGSGAYLLETMPNVLYILARHAGDPEQAIIRAVNDTKDNDTIAAMVGAAVGALHGKAALPERWLKGLLGRTNDRNDGHIFRLIDEARQRFG